MRAELEGIAAAQPQLADVLDAGWETSLRDWSAALWANPPEGASFEPAFRDAIASELALRMPPDDASRIVRAVERTGAVLTPHHVTPTNGPTFGAIDRIATAGAPGPVLVLAWSGVPMSNTAASGALCFSRATYGELLVPGPELSRQQKAAKDRERDGVTERRLVLLPPELRDALVYRCPLPARMSEVLTAMNPKLAQLVPMPDTRPPEEGGEDYPSWAIRTCERIERRLTGRDDLYYVDLNRAAARYLATVLAVRDHPITRLVESPTGSLPGLESQSWFYARRPGKRESVETKTQGGPAETLIPDIVAGTLCPGLVPVFAALRLCSKICLLGGFRQVSYLEEIAAAVLAAGLVDGDRGAPGRLVTGRLRGRDGQPLYPLDVVLGTSPHGIPELSAPMSSLWEPLLPRLAQAVSSG